jgi:hypothetical protein
MKASILEEKTLPKYSQYSNLHLTRIPPYFVNQSHGNLEAIYKIRESVILEITCSTVLTYRDDNIASKFNQLASEVEEDCMMLSSTTQISLHPSYQQIIGIGKKVIPLLITRLDKTPNFWFKALESITGRNPIPKQDRGYLNKEKAHWKNWAKENDYV